MNNLCVDATRYRIPQGSKPDVIVSETMAVCLRNEPQVSIARNLLSQAPGARMVPQSVSVEACMLNPGKEIAVLPPGHTGEMPEPERDRIYLGKIFELDAAAIRRWECLEGDRLPGGKVIIPSPLEKGHQPYLLTRIAVYGENRLQDYDCSLTIPQPWPGRPVFSGGERMQFCYKLEACPELGYEMVNRAGTQ